MLYKLLETPHDRAGIVIRLALGMVVFPHGAQKLLGWFGGPGADEALAGSDLPLVFALITYTEFFGSVGLITGLFTRACALGIGIVTAGGFFVALSGNPNTGGFEYHILALGLALALVIRGGGAWSLDRHLTSATRAPWLEDRGGAAGTGRAFPRAALDRRSGAPTLVGAGRHVRRERAVAPDRAR